jgi:hypothetical protein
VPVYPILDIITNNLHIFFNLSLSHLVQSEYPVECSPNGMAFGLDWVYNFGMGEGAAS